MQQMMGTGSFVLCDLAGAVYGIPSDAIEQLEMVGAITPVPNAPGFVDGVTSVRGKVVPVVNLRARFGFDRAEADMRSRLVIVRSGQRIVGLLVDGAREFATIPEASIQAPPEGLAELSSRYLVGMAHLGDRLVLVLDIPELLHRTDITTESGVELLPAAT
jgi:chemotaxis signal transduction protein